MKKWTNFLYSVWNLWKQLRSLFRHKNTKHLTHDNHDMWDFPLESGYLHLCLSSFTAGKWFKLSVRISWAGICEKGYFPLSVSSIIVSSVADSLFSLLDDSTHKIVGYLSYVNSYFWWSSSKDKLSSSLRILLGISTCFIP